MTLQTPDDSSSDPDDLRRRALDQLQRTGIEPGDAIALMDAVRLNHELQIHRVELELQNEELRRARESVELERDKYRSLYQFAPVGLLTLSCDGRVQELNSAAVRLLGRDRSGLLGQKLSACFVGADRQVFDSYLDALLIQEGCRSCELMLEGGDGASIEVHLEAELREGEEGCLVVLSDVSLQRQSERDRLLLNKLQSTGTLAGGLAHDFNNLLTVILLDLEMAKLGVAGEKGVSESLDDAKDTVLEARSLVRMLGSLSAGEGVVQKRVGLRPIIESSVRVGLAGSRVEAEVTVDDSLMPVVGDEGQLALVLRNLILNSREAMPEGGMIAIRAQNVEVSAVDSRLAPGRYVLVNLTDSGKGIPESLVSQVFDPYFSTKERGEQKGMGLGLSISQAIIQRHGGAISVKSEKEKGFAVRFLLPAAEGQAEPEPKVVFPATVLVVDDEEGVRRLMGLALRSMKCQVELVSNGRAGALAYARAKAQGRPFDLVFLDLTVRGGVGGRAALELLQEMDPDVRAILMSGSAYDPEVIGAEAQGFKGVLAKPFSLESIRDLVGRVMD